MIADWRTYSVQDFIPFTPEVYFRLIARVNEAQWPLHLVMILGGIVVAALLLCGRGRVAGALLTVIWIWTGVSFLIQRYAELTGVAHYFGWAFCIQGLVLLACGLAGRLNAKNALRLSGPQWLGCVIIAFGLFAYPLLAPLSGSGWARSETFGIHPDPTAIATLGILLIATQGWSLWVSSIIPLLWCVIAGLTLWALEAPWAMGVPIASALALAGMGWKIFAFRHKRDIPLTAGVSENYLRNSRRG